MLEQRLVVLGIDAGEDLYEEVVLEVEESETGCRRRLGVPARRRRFEVDRGGRDAPRRLGGGGEQQHRQQADSG